MLPLCLYLFGASACLKVAMIIDVVVGWIGMSIVLGVLYLRLRC